MLPTIKQALDGERAEAVNAKDRANQRPAHRPKKSESVYNNENDVHTSKRPAGNSAAAFLRRLRKDAPAIHARVLAGELTAQHGTSLKSSPAAPVGAWRGLYFGVDWNDVRTTGSGQEIRPVGHDGFSLFQCGSAQVCLFDCAADRMS
jgi:hypothetical protein